VALSLAETVGLFRTTWNVVVLTFETLITTEAVLTSLGLRPLGTMRAYISSIVSGVLLAPPLIIEVIMS